MMLRRTARMFLRLAKEDADSGKAKPKSAKTASKVEEKKKPSPMEKKTKKKIIRLPDAKKAKGWNIFEIIEKIPKPIAFNPKDKATFVHKNGHGLHFARSVWFRYPEPSFYTVTKFKPSMHGHRPKVWGVLTWRGKKTSEKHEQIRSSHKREWRLITDPSPPIPFELPSKLPVHAYSYSPETPSIPPTSSTSPLSSSSATQSA